MEKEPNDSFAAATPLALNNKISGYSDTPDDIDFYRFEISVETVCDIGLSGVRGVNHALKLWKGGENPVVVKIIDDGRKSSPERFANLYAEPGVYYITVMHGDRDVRKANDEMPYELLVSGRKPGKEEREPNDTPDTANSVISGEEIQGFFSPACNKFNVSETHPAREEDWYTLNIEIESKPKLLDVSLSGVKTVSSFLAVYDQDKALMKAAGEGGAGQPVEIKGVGMVRSGAYYILVASKGYGSNHDEPYYLKTTLGDYDPSRTMEPNDTFETANPVVDEHITGRLEPGDEKDFFFFEPKDKMFFGIELVPLSDLNAAMTVYGGNRRKLFECGPPGMGPKLQFPDFYTNEKFYISVYAKTPPVRAVDFDLYVRPLEMTENLEIEPNDVLAQASHVIEGRITGFTSKPHDRDYFLLEYNRRVNTIFRVKAPGNGEIKVSVTDPLGYILKSAMVKKDKQVTLTEMTDRKGYVIVDSVIEDYDNPYTIIIRGKK